MHAFSAFAAPEEEFKDQIRPILEKNCFECHGPDKQKADINFASFAEYEQVTNDRETWQKALEMVQAFEMPPKGKKEMSFNDHGKLLRWLRRLPKPERPDCDQIASDRTANFYKGYVMSRRLNRAEYHNTLRDLLGVELQLGDLLPADGGGGEGFDTSGNALFTSSIHIEKYLAAAETALETVFNNVEYEPARSRILVTAPSRRLPAREAARKIIASFARKAFRRPVTPEETERLLGLYDRGQKRGDRFVPSVRLALTAVLISPHFLFLAEPEPGKEGVHKLGGVPLASKLSYFLWSTMPDEELLALGESGGLLEEETYRKQIRRMLDDPKARALGERFALQWLDLDRLGTEVRPDAKKFPEFDADLDRSMRAEVVAYCNYVFQKDRPLLDLIDSDYTFVNDRLAKLYGISSAQKDSMQKVSLKDRNRGGITGMAAVHAATSYPLRTSPVLRGKWVMESLLGDRVKPPPPDVPALEEAETATAVSLRAQLEKHRLQAECAACHDKMDPLGFGLENFDVLGRWRDNDRGHPIDAQGTLPSGQSFMGPVGLKSLLMERKDDIIKHLVRKMTGYAFGRELNQFDQCVVDRTMETLQKNDYRAMVLVEQIATSFPFRHRFYPKQD
jgi:Protein of unknown function (DUF1592)/Protein of unknown function (DUF1588)/Protein of unknown function (DUF1587)/Protein of unknown function (DUF1595)/Protein of unknown function (DUF1585)/Planctomycete cytochrome C